MAAPTYDKTYTDLPLWVSRDEEQGAYIFGTTFGGIDVVIAASKLGGIDSDLLDAQQAKAQQVASDTPAQPDTQPSEPPPDSPQQ